MNQSCYALRPRDETLSAYFLFLSILEGVNQLKQRATGAVFDAIIVDTFKQMELVKPNQEIHDTFINLVEPIFKQIDNLLLQTQQLIKAREILLPRLMDGRVAV